jgi:hypothetical protein
MFTPAEAAESPAAAPPAPAATAPPATTRAYSPEQMYRFAHATVELQSLRQQDPASMSSVIQDAGMSVEDYNEMGDAMRADPALASSLNPYLNTYNSERAQRLMAQQATYDRNAPARSTHHAGAHTRTARHAHATARSDSRTHKALHGTSHKAKSSQHAASGHAHHTALTPASHHHHHHHHRT